jgi:hypothetical protein
VSRNHVILWSLFASVFAHAQATLRGTVYDPSGAVVPKAAIVAAHQNPAISVATSTDAAGQYSLTLRPGPYRLTASFAGFVQGRRDLTISGSEVVLADFPLTIEDSYYGLFTYPNPNPLHSGVHLDLDQTKIAALPLDGRNFIPLLALSPGVSFPPGSTLPRVNGSRPRTSEYIYDGISVLQPEPGQVPFYPIIDAIQDVEVKTSNAPAEYGRSNGGVIIVNQRAGTSTFHGTLFEFFRNEKLNARNLFATTGPKPRFRRNQYGFVFGGPIQKNKTFFFIDWQDTRLNTGTVRTATVPTAAQRDLTTRFAAFDPVALSLLARYPTPTSSATANNYRRIATDSTAQDQFDLRLDHFFTPNHRTFARYTFLRDDARIGAPLAEANSTVLTRADGLAANHSWSITPTLLNEFRFGFTRRDFHRNSLASPIYDIAGYQSLGPAAGSIGRVGTSVTQFLDHLTKLAGNHTVKAGADIRLQHFNALQPSLPNGQFQFNTFDAFLLGQVNRYNIDIQSETLRPRATIAEFFIQDDWFQSRRLKINAGLRYTLNFPSTVVGDRGAVFNLRTQQLDYLGKNGFPRSARNLEKANFGPRLGLAYLVTNTLALRAAYGLTWFEQSGITTPFTTPLYPFIQTLTQQSHDNRTPAFLLAQGPTVKPTGLGQNVFGVQRDNGSGYAQQWNLSLQKSFGDTWSVEAGYLGSKLTRLGVPDVNLNQLTVDQLKSRGTQPYPTFNNVALYRNNVGHSTYHSFQARLERRFSNHLSLNFAYTVSRLIDDAGTVFDAATLSAPVATFNVADSHNRRLEKDVSTGNIPHIFSAGLVYDLPYGIQFAGILRAQAGSPLAVIQAVNSNAFAGFGIQRPNRSTDPTLPADQRTTARWFNTAAFTQAPQFTIGNSSRNPVSGAGYRTFDLMLGKTFHITDRTKLELRAEAFNLTNTPGLGAPNTTFGASAFGSITTASDPRVFELVGKVHF